MAFAAELMANGTDVDLLFCCAMAMRPELVRALECTDKSACRRNETKVYVGVLVSIFENRLR